MRRLLIIVVICFSTFSYSQSVDGVLKKVAQEYSDTKPLQFNTKYNLYKNSSQKKVFESYIGQFKKNEKNEVYQKIDKTEFVWNKNICLKVVHPDKLINISISQPLEMKNFDIASLKEWCDIKSFVDRKSYWELILTTKAFSSLPYSKIVIHIGKNYFIQKQLFYYNSAVDFSTDYRKQNLDYPVLEIIYSSFTRKKESSTFFNMNKFIEEKSKLIKTTKEFQSYTIEDHREVTFK
jgi:hypothetical protein